MRTHVLGCRQRDDFYKPARPGRSPKSTKIHGTTIHDRVGKHPAAEEEEVPENKPRVPAPTRFKIILLLLVLCTLYEISMFHPQLYLVDPDPAPAVRTTTPTPARNKTAMCTISKYEEAYLDEFVDYHHALGFDHFYIYDNSEGFELKQWGRLKGDHVEVIHFPGPVKQLEAYGDCIRQMKTTAAFEWAAFFDVDEFLVLKQHDHVADMLQEYCPSGGLSVSWFLFFWDNNWNLYSPQPVTKRFVFHHGTIQSETKTIARVDDIERLRDTRNPHNFLTFKNDSLFMKDSNGKRMDGPFNKDGPTDVVVLHHYRTKSLKEFLQKQARGRADIENPYDDVNETIVHFKNALASDRLPYELVKDDGYHKKFERFDDSAWQFLKKKIPAYALFDEIAVSPPITKQQQQGASF